MERLTRDDLKWWVGIVFAVALGLASLNAEAAAAVAIPEDWLPYIRLVALVGGIISGKMATSPLPGKNDGGEK